MHLLCGAGGLPDQYTQVALARDVPVTPLESYHPEQSTARWDPMGCMAHKCTIIVLESGGRSGPVDCDWARVCSDDAAAAVGLPADARAAAVEAAEADPAAGGGDAGGDREAARAAAGGHVRHVRARRQARGGREPHRAQELPRPHLGAHLRAQHQRRPRESPVRSR